MSWLRISPPPSLVHPSGQDWTNFYYFTASLGVGVVPTLCVLLFFAFGNFVLLSLFVAIILENFETKENDVEKEQAAAYDRLQALVLGECSMHGFVTPTSYRSES